MKELKLEALTVQFIMKKFSDLGARMVIGCLTAVISVALIFFAPEIGIAGGICGLAFAAVSAVLIHPTHHV